MKFSKMHGAGNDYIYVNGFEEWVPDPAKVSILLSDRHFGIGGDGLVLILPSETADFRMRMFNADGSEGEMCGNAIRCVAKYVYDKGMTRKKEISIETLAGIRQLTLFTGENNLVGQVCVWMGQPGFSDEAEYPDMLGRSFPVPVTVADRVYPLHCVSMGNPHAVAFVRDVDGFPVKEVGTAIQRLPMFPREVNVEFVRVLSGTSLQMRVWERGSGETLACGTGACAAAAAAMRLGLVERRCSVKLPGGTLEIEWKTDGIYMTGPASFVFEGEVHL
jgi:diaminopimelate epimerase